jgi:adenosine deaminase
MEATSMNHECEEAIFHSDVTDAELRQLSFNSIKTSFAAPETRAELLSNLERDWATFEARWQSRQ